MMPPDDTMCIRDRTLSVPAGCIPLCVKMEGGLSVYSGKGESPSYYLQVKDNNGKIYYYATRSGGSGSISSGSPSLYLNPLAAYDGDLKVASSITSVSITASNGAGNLISNYTQPKMSVTMWLEKIGGGSVNRLKSLLVSRFSCFAKALNVTGKEVSNMLFGGSKRGVNKSPIPKGYELKTGICDSSSASNNGTVNRLIPTGIIPLTIKCEWSANNSAEGWYINFNISPSSIGWNSGIVWSGGKGSSCSCFMDVEAWKGLEYLKTCKYYGGTAVNGNGTIKFTIVKWLEKVGE